MKKPEVVEAISGGQGGQAVTLVRLPQVNGERESEHWHDSPLRPARPLAETSCMEQARNSEPCPDANAAWVDGYETAIEDAVRLIDGMGGPSFSNLSSPVLARLKVRLRELREKERRGAA